jgi:hypothetical protein
MRSSMVGGWANWAAGAADCPVVDWATSAGFGRGGCATCGAAAAINAAVVPGVNSGPGWYGAVGRSPSVGAAAGGVDEDWEEPAVCVCSMWAGGSVASGSGGGTSWTSFLKPFNAFPSPSPSCGRRPAPKMISTITRIMISSENPIVPNIHPPITIGPVTLSAPKWECQGNGVCTEMPCISIGKSGSSGRVISPAAKTDDVA